VIMTLAAQIVFFTGCAHIQKCGCIRRKDFVPPAAFASNSWWSAPETYSSMYSQATLSKLISNNVIH
jgi:hypothetical protein